MCALCGQTLGPSGLLFSLVSSRSPVYGQLQLCFSRQQRPEPAVIKENDIKDCSARERGEEQVSLLRKRLILFLANIFFPAPQGCFHATCSVLLPLQCPIDFQYLMMFVHAVMKDGYRRGLSPSEGDTCILHLCPRSTLGPPGTFQSEIYGETLGGETFPVPGVPWAATASLLSLAVSLPWAPCPLCNVFPWCLISSPYGQWRLISVQEV